MEHFSKIYKDLGIEIEIIDQEKNQPDMVFANRLWICFWQESTFEPFFALKKDKERHLFMTVFRKHGYENYFTSRRSLF